MKTILLNVAITLISFLCPIINFAQAPDLGSASSFALFTASGAFSNIGASTTVTGDVGTNVGAFSAFPPGILIGQSHVADPASASAATDVDNAYGGMSTITCGDVLSTTMGGGQMLLPNVYCLGAASTINGDLILDGGGDPTSLFIFLIDGALATTVGSRIILTNSASLCNVYWRVNGEVDLGENSVFQGTILANGAINLLDGATLLGRGLSRAGAIGLHNNVVNISSQQTAATIMAGGPTTFCEGGSVTLSGNDGGIWSNGAVTPSITVSTGGDYFATTGCGIISNHIIVTVSPLAVASTISAGGPTTFCEGGSVILSGNNGGTWSTGATTSSITVSASGDYYVTNTNACGDVFSNHITVTVTPLATASTITAGGPISFCEGGSVILSGNSGGTWSNGATTGSITVTASGDYYVTNPGTCGNATSNHIMVTVNPLPACTITGNAAICPGQSGQLCVAAGAASYSWNTGATTNCINITAAGIYSVTVTNANGCTSTCSKTVTVTTTPSCTITGNGTICVGQSIQLCVPTGATGYSWSTGATTNCITVTAAGTYSVTVTNSGGCTSTCSKTIVATTAPSCTITGSSTICTGQSTQLCAPAGSYTYKWSTGATTSCITVITAGTYSVTVTNSGGCSSTCSKTVTTAAAPSCTITGNGSICVGQSTQLCAPAACGSYKWSTGATTSCITVTTAGIYSVTVTNAGGCSSTCSKTVTTATAPSCTITGNGSICAGQFTQLCAPAGCGSYKWSTGATTSCITVTAAGTYSVTVTNAGGCSSTCSKTVTTAAAHSCMITGTSSICTGQSTQLCAPVGCGSYKWSTGATTSCITVTAAGTYSVTVTNAGGCSSTCSITVTSTSSTCIISGSSTICQGKSTQLCAPAGCATYKWSTGATTSCITVSTAGTYSVTVKSSGGVTSTCSKIVTVATAPSCLITGNLHPQTGKSTQLCAPAGYSSYKWSTGATTSCITVSNSGTYTVTVTNSSGCTSSCSATISCGSAGSRIAFVEPAVPVLNGNIIVKTYPNPFKSKSVIELQNVKSNSHLSIELYSSTGNKIATLFNSEVKGGMYQVEVNAGKLPSGVYFYRIINGDEIINRKLVVAK